MQMAERAMENTADHLPLDHLSKGKCFLYAGGLIFQILKIDFAVNSLRANNRAAR